MKANRITMIVCAAIVILSGISIAFISNDLAKNITVSIFTGFIVYFNERAVLLEKIEFNIITLYINMTVLKKTIGKALLLIKQAPDTAEAQIKRIPG